MLVKEIVSIYKYYDPNQRYDMRNGNFKKQTNRGPQVTA